jgi:hypothetical protein
MSIEPGKDSWVHFFVRFSQSLLKEEKSKSMPLLLKIENDALDSNSIDLEVNLIGP